MTYVPFIWLIATALCYYSVWSHGDPRSYSWVHYLIMAALSPFFVAWATIEFISEEFKR